MATASPPRDAGCEPAAVDGCIALACSMNQLKAVNPSARRLGAVNPAWTSAATPGVAGRLTQMSRPVVERKELARHVDIEKHVERSIWIVGNASKQCIGEHRSAQAVWADDVGPADDSPCDFGDQVSREHATSQEEQQCVGVACRGEERRSEGGVVGDSRLDRVHQWGKRRRVRRTQRRPRRTSRSVAAQRCSNAKSSTMSSSSLIRTKRFERAAQVRHSDVSRAERVQVIMMSVARMAAMRGIQWSSRARTAEKIDCIALAAAGSPARRRRRSAMVRRVCQSSASMRSRR